MKADQHKWEEKYQSIDYRRNVASILAELAPELSNLAPGKALDIACGLGQNSQFLADLGFQVDAVDISPTALGQFEREGIAKYHRDLDTYRFPEKHYKVIANFYYLERRLFPFIISALEPGGILIFETYLDSRESLSNPDHKLRSQELLHAFLPLNIQHYVEKGDVAQLVARK